MTHVCRFVWVQTWHRCGFEECRDCGRTQAYGPKPETFEQAAEAVVAEHAVALDLLAKSEAAELKPSGTGEPPKRPVVSARDLAILNLRDKENKPYEEIGRRFGLGLGHIYRIVSRARMLLGAKVPHDQVSNDPVQP